MKFPKKCQENLRYPTNSRSMSDIATLNQLWCDDGLRLEGGVHLNPVGARLKGGPQPKYTNHVGLLYKQRKRYIEAQ